MQSPLVGFYGKEGAVESVRILLVSQYWSPESGIPQRRWSWLSDMLSKSGHEVLVIAPPPNFARESKKIRQWTFRGLAPSKHLETGPNGEKILRSGYLPTGRSLTLRILNQAGVACGMLWAVCLRRRTILEFNPDLIIATVPALPTAFVGWAASRFLGVPYVIDLRDAWPDLLRDWEKWNSDLGSRSPREKLLRLGPAQLLVGLVGVLVNFCLSRASGLMLTSELLAADMVAKRSASAKISVPVSVIRNVFPSEVKQVANRRELDSIACLNVLYAGTVGRAQQLSNMLYAAALLKAEKVPIAIRVLGDGAARRSLMELADELGVDATFEGKVGAQRLQESYEWAHTALVHLADWEPLRRAVPSKTYELMEQGIHISAVVEGETRMLIEENGAGFVVDPDDPQALADKWKELFHEPSRLGIEEQARNWVIAERDITTPKRLARFLEEMYAGE